MAEKAFKVDIDTTVADGVNTFADGLGMKNKAVVERLFRYFLAQPDPVQRYMIGLVKGNEGAAIDKHVDIAGKIGGERPDKRVLRTPRAARRLPRDERK